MNINKKNYLVFFILIFALSACKTTSGTKWIEINQEPLDDNEKSEFIIIVEKKNSPEDEVNTYRGTSTMPAYSRDARFQIVIDDQNEQNAKFHFFETKRFCKNGRVPDSYQSCVTKNSKMQSFIF